MSIGKFIMNPFALLFITLFLGMAFGKIKIKKFSFGACGALIVGLVFGWMVMLYANGIGKASPLYKTASQMISKGVISSDFSNFFLILFVVSVGLISGKQVVSALKKYGMKFLTIGFAIPLIAFILTFAAMKVTNVNPYQISGVYSGSMLSSPTFAVSLDSTGSQAQKLADEYPSLNQKQKQKVLNMIDTSLKAQDVKSLSSDQKSKLITAAKGYTSMGHSITYPVGILVAIITIITIPKAFGMDIDEERKKFRSTVDSGSKKTNKKEIKTIFFDVTAFGLTAFLGVLLGDIKIKSFSLGIAGGALIVALVLSAIGKIGPLNFRMDDKVLGVTRSIGLSLFLSATGLNYGYNVVKSIASSGLQILIIGALILFISMMSGYFIGRYIFKLDWLALSGALCGGITNTPTLGAAIDSVKGDEPAIGYGAVYPFGLIFKIIFVIILHKAFLI